MKYKCNPGKSNKFVMNMLLCFIIFTSTLWLILREYVYFFVYLFLAALLWHMYYFSSYEIKDNYFVYKVGFLKFKIKYKDIKEVIKNDNKIILKLKYIRLGVYVENIQRFYMNLLSKMER